MREQNNSQNPISNFQQISNIHYKFISKITFKPYYKFSFIIKYNTLLFYFKY